jgi:hypothetical protein
MQRHFFSFTFSHTFYIPIATPLPTLQKKLLAQFFTKNAIEELDKVIDSNIF